MSWCTSPQLNKTMTPKNSKQYAFVFDIGRCIGCETCTIACKLENDLAVGENWIKVQKLGDPAERPDRQKYPDLKMSFQPVTCMHCQNAPCIAACPDKAIARRDDGIVLIDPARCTGCELCLPACPYTVIHFDKGRSLATKCNFCVHRVDQGEEPLCARECPVGAIHFGDTSAGGGLAKLGGYALQPENGARPVHRYLR